VNRILFICAAVILLLSLVSCKDPPKEQHAESGSAAARGLATEYAAPSATDALALETLAPWETEPTGQTIDMEELRKLAEEAGAIVSDEGIELPPDDLTGHNAASDNPQEQTPSASPESTAPAPPETHASEPAEPVPTSLAASGSEASEATEPGGIGQLPLDPIG
jgi:hypothetical protein